MTNLEVIVNVLVVVWGLVVKYHPAWKNFPNLLIPYVGLLANLLAKIAAPDAANASELAFVGTISLAHLGIVGTALSAGWNAILNSLVYEVFLRHPIQEIGIQKQ